MRGQLGAFRGFYEPLGAFEGLRGSFEVTGGAGEGGHIEPQNRKFFKNRCQDFKNSDLDGVPVRKAEHMTLHVAYQNGRMHAEVDILLSESASMQYKQLRYVDAWGDTALSLAMTLGEERDDVIMKLLHMDHWALGVRSQHTGNFPVHVVFQQGFTLETRILVAHASECIVCSYNLDGNTALHVALLSGCDDATIAQLDHILGLKTVMLSVFVHENKAKQTPLVMAVGRGCSEKTIMKMLERTMLAVSHWMEFFAEWNTNVIGDNVTMDQTRIFGSVVCVETETDVVYKSSGYLFCGSMIELESTQDCENSMRNKRSLICLDFASNVNDQCLQQGNSKMHLKICAKLGKRMRKSILTNITRMNASDARLPIQQEIDAADCMAALLIQEEEQDNTAKATKATKAADAKATKAADANAGNTRNPANITKLHFRPVNHVGPTSIAANTTPSTATCTAANAAANAAADTAADTAANTAANTSTATSTAANTATVSNTCNSAGVPQLLVNPVRPANAASSANSSIDNRNSSIDHSTATVSTQHTPEPKSTSTEHSRGHISDANDRRECCMCFGENRNTALVPCHHMCLCETCAVQLMLESKPKCPICRRHVQATIKLYF